MNKYENYSYFSLFQMQLGMHICKPPEAAGCSGSRGKAPISLSPKWVCSQLQLDPKSDPTFQLPFFKHRYIQYRRGRSAHGCVKSQIPFLLLVMTVRRKSRVFP